MNRRKVRENQYLNPPAMTWGHADVSPELLGSANFLLLAALEERSEHAHPRNHHAHHALGATVLRATAFDVWLIEVVQNCREFRRGRSDDDWAKIALAPIPCRYARIAMKLTGQSLPLPEDAGLLLDVRHEIVHDLPRPFANPHGVPDWLVGLSERGLLWAPAAFGDVPAIAFAGWMYSSYALAYWGAEATAEAAMVLAGAVRASGDQSTCEDATNFTLHRSIPSPTNLHEHDRQRGLKLRQLDGDPAQGASAGPRRPPPRE
jgi:hypothetical protein